MTSDDRVLLITGASSGIGWATARSAAEKGYRLVLAARSADRLQALADELGGEDQALAVECDVTEFDAQQSMVKLALEHFGHLDVVFANAGFGAPRGFLESSVEHWRSMVLTNVLGVALTVRATLPVVRESGGHFVLTGSVAGRRALPGSLYSATKFAVTAIGEGLRQELDGSGVRVTLIEPGMVDTPFFDRPVSDALEPEDVSRAVMYALDQPPHVDAAARVCRLELGASLIIELGRGQRQAAMPFDQAKKVEVAGEKGADPFESRGGSVIL